MYWFFKGLYSVYYKLVEYPSDVKLSYLCKRIEFPWNQWLKPILGFGAFVLHWIRVMSCAEYHGGENLCGLLHPCTVLDACCTHSRANSKTGDTPKGKVCTFAFWRRCWGVGEWSRWGDGAWRGVHLHVCLLEQKQVSAHSMDRKREYMIRWHSPYCCCKKKTTTTQYNVFRMCLYAL